MLTDTQCRNAKPKAKPYRLTDSHGLCLEVKPSGVKAWRYRFQLGGRENLFAIGDYSPAPSGESPDQAQVRRDAGAFTLAEAREERTKARALVKQGINPAANRQLLRIKREQANAITFKAVAEEWLTLKGWEEITKTKRRNLLNRVVYPTIGRLPVDQIKPSHILDILQRTAKNAPTVAAEAKRTMSGIFELAIATLRAEVDPVYPVRKALPPNKTQHKRPLSVEEIGRLLRDWQAYRGDFKTKQAFRLMWLTLCRPSEVVGARWAEINLDTATWHIPAERMKKRKDHIVPLPTQAVELLKAMQPISGHSALVFPNRDHPDQPATDNAFRQALKNIGWATKFSPHATRTTGSTRLNDMGYSADWIERQLAHVEQNAVRRTYNHADYLDGRRGMMQNWADMLDAWRDGAKVVPMKRAA
jgi:integrase